MQENARIKVLEAKVTAEMKLKFSSTDFFFLSDKKFIFFKFMNTD